MKKILALLILTVATVGAAGGFKNFSEDIIRFGGSTAGVRSFVFDRSEDANSAKITVDPADEFFNFNNQVNVNNRLLVTSILEASKPYPTMTILERDALTPIAGDTVFNSDDNQLNIYDGVAWGSVGGGGLDKWATATDYEIDDVIWLEDDNKIYRATANFTSGVFTPANWTELSDQFYLDADNNLREGGAKFADKSFTYDGYSEFNDTTVWTIGNGATFGVGAGGTAVTKDPVKPIDGTSSWKVASANQNDWVMITYAPTAQIADRALVNTGSFKYETTLGSDWEFRVTCDSTALIDAASGSALDENKGRMAFDYTIPQSCALVKIGLQCVNAAGCVDINFAKMKASDEPREVKDFTVTDSYHAKVDSSYNLSTIYRAMTENLVTVDDTDGNNIRITNISGKPLMVNASSYIDAGDAGANTFAGAGWFDSSANPLTRSYSVDLNVTAPYRNNASANVKLASGDYIYTNFQRSAVYVDASVNFTVTSTSSGTVFASETSAEDVLVRAISATGGSTLLNTPINFTEILDDSNIFNGTEIVPNESGLYRLEGLVASSVSLNYAVYLFQDTSNIDTLGFDNISNGFTNFGKTVYLEKGETYTIRPSATITQVADNFHNLVVSKISSRFDNMIIAKTSHVTGGTEYDTHETWNGKQIYARSYEVLSNISSNTTIDTLPTGLEPKGLLKAASVGYIVLRYAAEGSGSESATIRFDASTGVLATFHNAYSIEAGTTFTIKYTK